MPEPTSPDAPPDPRLPRVRQPTAPRLPARRPRRGRRRRRGRHRRREYAYRATRAAPASEAALENAQAGLLPPVPFEGKYLASILPQPQRQTAVISFHATAEGRGELTDLFQTITARARFLTAGGAPPPVGIGGAPADSGVLGATVVPDGLTVTVGVGSTLFDDRYGLAAQLPAKLTADAPVPQRQPRPHPVRRPPGRPAQRGPRQRRHARAA